MHQFEKKEVMKKRTFAKNTSYDWLINCIPEPIKNCVVLKTKLLGFFKTNNQGL